MKDKIVYILDGKGGRTEIYRAESWAEGLDYIRDHYQDLFVANLWIIVRDFPDASRN